MFKGQSNFSKNTTSEQTTLDAKAHLAKGHFFTRRADSEHRKDPDIPSRNSETNGFQNGRTEFRATVNKCKKQCIKVIPPLL
jgi:hypothetical protein